MSGHNKWSKIKHKKAHTDAVKSKIFSKHAALIASESRKSGGDREAPGLRAAIENAGKANMPKENIERAIEKGSGPDAAALEEVLYEAYGPSGVAIVITGLTENKNRTAQQVKQTLREHGTELAESGAALWNFKKTNGQWQAQHRTSLPDSQQEKLNKLTEALEELDEVQAVFTSAKGNIESP